MATCYPAAHGSVEVPRQTTAAATARTPTAKRAAPGRTSNGDLAGRNVPGSSVDGRDASADATAPGPVGVPEESYAEADTDGGGGVGVARRAAVQVCCRFGWARAVLVAVWAAARGRWCVAASLKSQLPVVAAARRCAVVAVARIAVERCAGNQSPQLIGKEWLSASSLHEGIVRQRISVLMLNPTSSANTCFGIFSIQHRKTWNIFSCVM